MYLRQCYLIEMNIHRRKKKTRKTNDCVTSKSDQQTPTEKHIRNLWKEEKEGGEKEGAFGKIRAVQERNRNFAGLRG